MANVPLIEKKEIAEGTMAFSFARPEGFAFKAGQFAEVTLINPPETDGKGNTRAFTIASAPHEDGILVATRMRDTVFKRLLKSLPVGTEVALDGPFGSFTLHNDRGKEAVFLIGGIGITPVRSIIADVASRKLPHRITLFYSNRRPEDAAFLGDLQTFQKENPNFRLVATMTEMPAHRLVRRRFIEGGSFSEGGEKSSQPWDGPRGFITADLITSHVKDLANPIWYLAGPAAMVGAMRKTLSDLKVDDDNIRTEEFGVY